MFIYGNRLKQTRLNAQKTQAEYAQILGMEQPNYQRLERGTLDIKISMLINICSKLDISADWLLGLTEQGRVCYEKVLGNYRRLFNNPHCNCRRSKKLCWITRSIPQLRRAEIIVSTASATPMVSVGGSRDWAFRQHFRVIGKTHFPLRACFSNASGLLSALPTSAVIGRLLFYGKQKRAGQIAGSCAADQPGTSN